jgi:16S rRNA (guanine527-N7)-methyltransferase
MVKAWPGTRCRIRRGFAGHTARHRAAAVGVYLVDSNRKRTRFLQQVVGDLGLDHVEIVHQRVEGLSPPIDYATVISRAFASLADMVTATAHLLSVNGTWLAMKGKVDPGELSALPETVTHEVVSLSVPGESASRHLVVLTPRYLD